MIGFGYNLKYHFNNSVYKLYRNALPKSTSSKSSIPARLSIRYIFGIRHEGRNGRN